MFYSFQLLPHLSRSTLISVVLIQNLSEDKHPNDHAFLEYLYSVIKLKELFFSSCQIFVIDYLGTTSQKMDIIHTAFYRTNNR